LDSFPKSLHLVILLPFGLTNALLLLAEASDRFPPVPPFSKKFVIPVARNEWRECIRQPGAFEHSGCIDSGRRAVPEFCVLPSAIGKRDGFGRFLRPDTSKYGSRSSSSLWCARSPSPCRLSHGIGSLICSARRGMATKHHEPENAPGLQGRCPGVYRVYRFAGLHEATFHRPVAYYLLAQGHGKTRSGAGQHSAQALGAVLAVRLSLRTQRCHRQSGGRSETANGQRERRQHAGVGDAQARKLLEAPPADTLKGVRDRAILATLLYHGIRREELCGLRVKDLHSRQGVMHFRVKGKVQDPLRSG
jgi:hypothetical protein